MRLVNPANDISIDTDAMKAAFLTLFATCGALQLPGKATESVARRAALARAAQVLAVPLAAIPAMSSAEEPVRAGQSPEGAVDLALPSHRPRTALALPSHCPHSLVREDEQVAGRQRPS